MLNVLYGPFHDLERAFLEELAVLAREYPTGPIAVVTPSRRIADRLERAAAVDEGLSLLGVEFHTFFSLAWKVLEEDPPELDLIPDPVFHDRVVDGLIDKSPAARILFGGIARPKALAAAVRSSLRDLIDAGVSQESLDEYFGDELPIPRSEKERLKGLLNLSAAYERKLEELGVLSPSGITQLAAERAGESAVLAGYRRFLYYGFYDLTGLQLDFFEAVTARLPATLYFPYRRGHPA